MMEKVEKLKLIQMVDLDTVAGYMLEMGLQKKKILQSKSVIQISNNVIQAEEKMLVTICELCPASMWQITTNSVMCYCQLTKKYSFNTQEPVSLLDCEGVAIAFQATQEQE
ncbi:hypothetical protein DKE50_021730 (plasmid) [Acinetobacter nosocomialis]|nr:hypothetical protein DKE50_021730 [Acinetobacter nosocomialis]